VSDILVNVRRHRLDTVKVAAVHYDDLANPRWADGVIVAYCWCDAFVAGEVSHSCCHGPAPHSIRVHISPRDNGRDVYLRLSREADFNSAHYQLEQRFVTQQEPQTVREHST
jgi:hypothetical protein